MDILKITSNIKEISAVFKQIRISMGMSITEIANIINKGKSSWQRYESERYWLNITKFDPKIREVSAELSNGIFDYFENQGVRNIYINYIQDICKSYLKDSKLHKYLGNYRIDSKSELTLLLTSSLLFVSTNNSNLVYSYISDYAATPSFYKSNEAFRQFLGLTSYYITVQSYIVKLVKLTNSNTILELGFGTGDTAIKVGHNCKYSKIVAIDCREEMEKLAEKNAIESGVSNIEFIVEDMIDYVKRIPNLPDFTFMAYTFHHIEDPLEKKIEFLKECKAKMKKGSYLCIAENFIPESFNAHDEQAKLNMMFSRRSQEAYASTFWNSLEGLSYEEVEKSNEIAKETSSLEWDVGQLVINRENEYLVKLSWLSDVSKKIGFKILLEHITNDIGESIILLTLEE